MILDERIAKQIKDTYQRLYDAGQLATREQLTRYYAAFRDRFSPEMLQSLDGTALLETMHAHRSDNRNSLVYWLEFKNDDEFPAIFGSIAGGSALKFGIYQRKETGTWMTGSPTNQRELTIDEAVEEARKHREQLVRGCELLESLPLQASDENYRQLQEEMNRLAPDVSTKAWGHKYFSLIYPDKLDDYHVEDYQRFHLIKLLQLPPEGQGRYLAAGRYVAIAHELEMPLNHLTTSLNQWNGRPYRYWRVGTRLGGKDSIWHLMQNENCVAVGWPGLGDLSHLSYDQTSKEELRAAMTAAHPNTPQVVGRQTQQLFYYVTLISEGDLVLAADGKRVLGIGRVAGDYYYERGTNAPHRRPVEWLSWEEWALPTTEGLQTTVHQVKGHTQNLIEVEGRILEAPPLVRSPEITELDGRTIPRLGGVPGRIQFILERKKQVILYGPPGTGKTFFARKTALDLAAYHSTGRPFDNLSNEQQQASEWDLVRMCTFHPAYGYEDFLEGYRPVKEGGQLLFERRDGIFKRLCDDARDNPARRYYLIIDEINRGDIPRIFGELLTVLEQDKRGTPILLPLSNEPFSVPDNVYVIGTMNTADRSIALLDTALRRRFGFLELMPDSSLLMGASAGNSIPLGLWLDALNSRILEHIGRDARNLQIGHAYLLESGRPVTDFGRFARVVQEDILPLLEEYCYEDYATLARILGRGLVDEEQQRIRHDLFQPARRDELIQALLSPFPEITTSSQAVASESSSLGEEDEDESEEPEDQESPA
jgi:5-methylcytosine-specific restriction protein B